MSKLTPALSSMTDGQMINHLEDDHAAEVSMRWVPGPGRKPEVGNRSTWVVWHSGAHLKSAQAHAHEEEPMAPQYAGKSLIEMIWDQLDEVMDRLMDGSAEETDKGKAFGIATSLAILRNPYDVPAALEAVRAEAMERWESRDNEVS